MRRYNAFSMWTARRGMIMVIALLVSLSLKLSPTRAAATVTDCTNYGPGAGTLQNALAGGGLITFACSGTIIVPEINITLDTTLDATGQTVILSGNNANRVLNIHQAAVQLIHLSIMNGAYTAANGSQGGAGIFNQGGDLTITDSIVAQNSLITLNRYNGLGGGLTNYNGTVTISGSQFYANSTTNGEGGAIHNHYGTITITNTTITNNRADRLIPDVDGFGGGIASWYGRMTLSNVTVSGNRAIGGGGIYSYQADITINNSTLSNNSVVGGGGAILSFGVSVTIHDSLIDGNTGGFLGGAIQNGGSDVVKLTVTGTTFSNNAVTGNGSPSSGQGGAIANLQDMDITTSTFTGNTATVAGRAIWYLGTSTRVVCSNITGNGGSAPDSIEAYPFGAPIADLRNNWWGDASGPSDVGPGTGDPVSGLSDFSGFLAAPATNADCVPPFVTPTPVPNPVTLPGVVQSSIPLCADLDGAVNPVVRAKIPSGVYGVYCRIIAENRQFTHTPAEIGVQSVLDEGVIHAVDVFSPSGVSAAGSQICLQGAGSIVFLDAVNAPRVPQTLSTTTQNGYTCATIPNEGTVVLVDARLPSGAPVVESAVVGDCQVTTTYQVNLRSEPNTTSGVIARLPYDITLRVTARSNGFFKVIYLDGQGWVSSDYVTAQGDCGG